MIRVIGKIGCSSCIELKEKLTKEGKDFEYIVFDTMPRDKKQKYAKIIREENNGHFPFVIELD